MSLSTNSYEKCMGLPGTDQHMTLEGLSALLLCPRCDGQWWEMYGPAPAPSPVDDEIPRRWCHGWTRNGHSVPSFLKFSVLGMCPTCDKAWWTEKRAQAAEQIRSPHERPGAG